MNYSYACLTALLPVATLTAAAAENPPTNAETSYRMIDGKVDEANIRGWQAFHSACHICHGVDATGTNVAPNLVATVKNLSARDFTTKALTSYPLAFPSGEVTGNDQMALRSGFIDEGLRRERRELVMPVWEGDRKIHRHVADLHAYLRARADGALGPGRPQHSTDKDQAPP